MRLRDYRAHRERESAEDACATAKPTGTHPATPRPGRPQPSRNRIVVRLDEVIDAAPPGVLTLGAPASLGGIGHLP
ncbi:hypothetical protein GCM10023196_082100 [Actinoallomurus vinaceus]|uniref:Uncharacterized protein n=1 Tax=Actinoallomurus vinaceus TaxID=1080074 RepID=A0ABP8UNL4_9ACTN